MHGRDRGKENEAKGCKPGWRWMRPGDGRENIAYEHVGCFSRATLQLSGASSLCLPGRLSVLQAEGLHGDPSTCCKAEERVVSEKLAFAPIAYALGHAEYVDMRYIVKKLEECPRPRMCLRACSEMEPSRRALIRRDLSSLRTARFTANTIQ